MANSAPPIESMIANRRQRIREAVGAPRESVANGEAA